MMIGIQQTMIAKAVFFGLATSYDFIVMSLPLGWILVEQLWNSGLSHGFEV